MANSGKDTNGSQLQGHYLLLANSSSFITFDRAAHLNLKHSVFGKVVGGNEVLTRMEKIPTDNAERPLAEIKIEKVTVWANPFRETKAEREAAQKKKEEEEAQKKEGMVFS